MNFRHKILHFRETAFEPVPRVTRQAVATCFFIARKHRLFFAAPHKFFQTNVLVLIRCELAVLDQLLKIRR
jgi:hypothetical protein